MPRKTYLEAGQVVGTHGVRGELRVQPWCDSPAQLAALKTLYGDSEGKTPLRIHARPHKNLALVKIDGVDTVPDAAALRGKILYLHRDDLKLPPDRYFIQDLVGMTIVDADDGRTYGTLTDVSETGANYVYHMTTTESPAREILIPAVPSVVIAVDLETDTVRLRPLKGLLDDEN